MEPSQGNQGSENPSFVTGVTGSQGDAHETNPSTTLSGGANGVSQTTTSTNSNAIVTGQQTTVVPVTNPMEAPENSVTDGFDKTSKVNPPSPTQPSFDLAELKPSSMTNGPSTHSSIQQSSSAPQQNQHQPQLDYMVLSRERLQELVSEIDPDEQLDEEVEDHLLQLADEFIENVVTTSCLFAKHRNSRALDVKDVQMSLEKNWGITIPGFGSADEIKQCPKYAVTEAHKQRLQLIKKNIKKF